MRKARVLVLAAVLAASGCDAATDGPLREHLYSEAAFNRWLAAAPGRAAEYERFERFLADRGVADVVPPWQLLRTDANYSVRCGIGAFEMPDEPKWPAIVPTLRLVEQEVAPVVGRDTSQRLIDTVYAIETIGDIRTLRPLLQRA